MESGVRCLDKGDIMRELNITEGVAQAFLDSYGTERAGEKVIRQPAFRLMQADGSAADFVAKEQVRQNWR